MKISATVLTLFVTCSLGIAAQDVSARFDHLNCPSALLGVFYGADLAISGRCVRGANAPELTIENRAGRKAGALTRVEANFCGDVRQVESPRGWRAAVRPGRITTIELVAERPVNGIKPGHTLTGFIVHIEGPWSWASQITYSFSKGGGGGAATTYSC